MSGSAIILYFDTLDTWLYELDSSSTLKLLSLAWHGRWARRLSVTDHDDEQRLGGERR